MSFSEYIFKKRTAPTHDKHGSLEHDMSVTFYDQHYQ